MVVKDVLSSTRLQKSVYESVEELAKELNISRATAYSGLRDGSIPSIRLKKRFIIPREAINQWLRGAGQRIETR
jgi:excisionase family DNA binding protein